MKNPKPSQLPENTVIDDERYGEYIKRTEGVWEEFESDMLGDKIRISDDGYESYDDRALRLNLTWKHKSDDYFKDYRVIAVPPEFVFVGDAESLHGPYIDALGGFSDGARPHECKGYNCEF
jgi:hypothetical protein